MIQLVSHHPLAPKLRARRLLDPDLLLTIAEHVRSGGPRSETVVNDFSLVVGDLRMGGTWKRTSRGRLTTATMMLCAHVIALPGAEVSVLDIGASDGLTTLDLAAALRDKLGSRVQVILADLNISLLRYRKGPVYEYRASDGEPIIVKVGRLGLRLGRARHDQSQVRDPMAAFYLRFKGFRRALRFDVRISLIHPLVHEEPTIRLMELDCLAHNRSLSGRFHAVRASNVLNSSYFAPAQIDMALRNVHAYLRDGGCLVISRNHGVANGETENGTVWYKDASGFSRIADFGTGSEIARAVDQWRVP